jgi:hypothetical protein
MATAAEIAQLLAEAMRPMMTQLSQQSDERIQRMTQESDQRVHQIMTDAQNEIRRLENEIRELRDNRGANNNANMKSMMDQKAFSKIDRFRDGHPKWKAFRTQVENLAEITYPGEGRKALRWARSIGASEIMYDDAGKVFNFMPPDQTTHATAHKIGQDLSVTLSYLLDGEADSILSNSGEGMGLDTWRRLQQRFDPKSNARDLVDSQRIVKPPQCKTLSELLPALERWEDAVRQMNEANQPPPLIKMGIVISMCPPKLQEHLQDMEERLTSYAQLRAEIIRKVDLAEISKDHRNTGTKHDQNH